MENLTIKELREMGVKVNIQKKVDIVTSLADLQEFLMENIDKKSIFYKGKEFLLKTDDSCENPLSWDNGFNFLSCTKFLNEENHKIIFDKEGVEFSTDDFENPDEIEEFLEKQDYIYFKIYATSHSGITLNPTYVCRFDSGVFGFFYVSKRGLKAFLGKKRLTQKDIIKHRNLMRNFCETLESYINGFVWNLRIDDENFTLYGFNDMQNFINNQAA